MKRFLTGLLLFLPLQAEAQVTYMFTQARPGIVQDTDTGDPIVRYIGVEIVEASRFFFMSYYVISDPYKDIELEVGGTITGPDSWIKIAPGFAAVTETSSKWMVGANVFIDVGGGKLLFPILRYVRSPDGDVDQWAIVTEVSLGKFRGLAQTLNDVWELHAGVALPSFLGGLPDIRLVRNVDGWGTEFRIGWEVIPGG